MRDLVLSPLGVLHDEPRTLLLDDLRDTTQAASILSLIGQGCHRPSEIAGRLQKPATSLSRPLERLMEMGLVRREQPFGAPARGGKRSLYRIDDPFIRFWFRYVEPNRSLLEARQAHLVAGEIARTLSHHVGAIWEELARASVPALPLHGQTWGPARSWWGAGLDRKPMEIDVVAESVDRSTLLLGEAKWTETSKLDHVARSLRAQGDNLPLAKGRRVLFALWTKRGLPDGVAPPQDVVVIGPSEVLSALR